MADRIHEVAALFGVDAAVLLSASRAARLMPARQALAWALRQDGLTLDDIGAAMGGRDHTTVLYSIEQAELRARASEAYAARLAELCPAPQAVRGVRYASRMEQLRAERDEWRAAALRALERAERYKAELAGARAALEGQGQ